MLAWLKKHASRCRPERLLEQRRSGSHLRSRYHLAHLRAGRLHLRGALQHRDLFHLFGHLHRQVRDDRVIGVHLQIVADLRAKAFFFHLDV